MFELSPRLYTAAHLTNPKLKTVDIGTDHAYLPAYMVSFLGSEQILACDIGEMPLENAKKTVESYGLSDKIQLRLSDGLKNVSPHEAEQITICGMGGTLIYDILSQAPWVRKPGMRLVLQPMTHGEDVRRYLCENGFEITSEKCVYDGRKLYCCICADYCGKTVAYEPGFLYFGTLINGGKAAEPYIQKQYDRIKKRADALSDARQNPEEVSLLRDILDYYQRMKKQ